MQLRKGVTFLNAIASPMGTTAAEVDVRFAGFFGYSNNAKNQKIAREYHR